MNNAILQAIADRRSNRGYAPEQITEEQLDALLRAAMQAPSARNTQPWHFSVVQDAALLDEFAADYARVTTAKIGADYHVFFRAPTVIFISTPKDAPTRFAQVDCGIAVQNIALAAHAIGLGSVIIGRPMDVFDSPEGDRYARAIGIPEDHRFAIAIAVGVPTLSKDAHAIREGLVTRV
jgi:nitroreductase